MSYSMKLVIAVERRGHQNDAPPYYTNELNIFKYHLLLFSSLEVWVLTYCVCMCNQMVEKTSMSMSLRLCWQELLREQWNH